jgi:Mg-chelatase subunit ChlD
MRETGLDIVFVFDATSSMAQFLKQVKEKIANLTATFKKLVPTARIGLVAYRDVGDDFVAKSHQLTHGTQSLQNFLRDIDPVGGGDWQESIGEALRVAIRDINWGKRTKKIILIIGDAPPHSKDMSAITSLINDFRNSMGGMVAALDTSAQTFKAISGKDSHQGETTKVLEDFKVIATLGGGESARLQDEEKVIRQMAIMVFGSKWEVCLDEFLKNL